MPLHVEDLAELALRAAAAAVPRSAGRAARFTVIVTLGADAGPAGDKEVVAGVWRRLKREGPAVRYSLRLERRADRDSKVQVQERVEAVALTKRDRDVLGFLAIARRLTVEQIIALAFPGRHVTIAYRRLALLSTARPNGGGYVRQEHFFGGTGARAKIAAWSVTNDGYSAVAPMLPFLRAYASAPAAAATLQHDLWLNGLFVAMATAHGTPVSPKDLPFRWLCDTDKPITFQTLDGDAEPKTNLLRPDAIIELPLARRRIFVEAERGTHTIAPTSTTNTGGTTVKARRYSRFVAAPVGPGGETTAYGKCFPDGHQPELLFLVHSEWRRIHVRDALRADRAKDANPPDFLVHVMTFDEAREFLLAALPADWKSAPAAGAASCPSAPEPAQDDAQRGREGPRARVRSADVQVLRDGFNALLDELRVRGGTKTMRARTKGTLQRARALIVWLVQASAAGPPKAWSGAERRRQSMPAALPRGS